MKRFAFSMQKILDLRENLQKQAEIELGKANAEVARLERAIDTVDQKKASVTKAFDAETNVATLSQIESHFFMLQQKKEELAEELEAAKDVAEQKRDVMRQAMQRTKALGKLKESKAADWKKDAQKDEELAADDVVRARR